MRPWDAPVQISPARVWAGHREVAGKVIANLLHISVAVLTDKAAVVHSAAQTFRGQSRMTAIATAVQSRLNIGINPWNPVRHSLSAIGRIHISEEIGELAVK